MITVTAFLSRLQLANSRRLSAHGNIEGAAENACELVDELERMLAAGELIDMGECDFLADVISTKVTPRSGSLGRGIYYEEDASGAVTIHDSRPGWTPIEKRERRPEQMKLGAA